MSGLSRRRLLGTALGLGLAGLCPPPAARASAARGYHVVVVGGGFGGATAARYLHRLLPGLRITVVEPRPAYWSCPMSNAYIAGLLPREALRAAYAPLAELPGVELRRARAARIDHERSQLVLAGGDRIGFDRLIAAPGVRLLTGKPAGYDAAAAERMPHAWQGGTQARLLRRRLAALGDGAAVAISVPARPFRCPPGPYERASLIAAWLQRQRRRAKVIVLDSNADFSKQALFTEAWQALYPGRIEWRPVGEDGAVLRVDAARGLVATALEEHRFDLVNVIPAQTAARFAVVNGLADETGWCPVAGGSFRSLLQPAVHVLGDACLAGPMPKSASAANSQAKNCALAIAAEVSGEPPPRHSLHNTCYSLADRGYGISVNMMYALDAGGRIAPVAGAGGTSPLGAPRAFRRREAEHAHDWFESIKADSFG